MGKKRTLESTTVLRSINVAELGALHQIRGNEKLFKPLMALINQIIYNDKEKVIGLVSDIRGSDKAVEVLSKQNFYRGRVSALVLLHSLMINAEEELEKRERKSG